MSEAALTLGELLEGWTVPDVPGLDEWRARVRSAQRVDEILLTPEQAAAWVGVGPDQIAAALPCIQIGGLRRFRPVLVQRFCAGTFSMTEYRAEIESPGLAKRRGNVYLIEAVGTDRIKIGFTEWSAERRLHRLQTSSPFALRVAASLPGSLAIERHLHRKHAADRILPTAEWFHVRGAVARLLDHVIKEGRWP